MEMVHISWCFLVVATATEVSIHMNRAEQCHFNTAWRQTQSRQNHVSQLTFVRVQFCPLCTHTHPLLVSIAIVSSQFYVIFNWIYVNCMQISYVQLLSPNKVARGAQFFFVMQKKIVRPSTIQAMKWPFVDELTQFRSAFKATLLFVSLTFVFCLFRKFRILSHFFNNDKREESEALRQNAI